MLKVGGDSLVTKSEVGTRKAEGRRKATTLSCHIIRDERLEAGGLLDCKRVGFRGRATLGTACKTLKGNAVKDLEAGKTVAESHSRSRETSGLHQKRPNSHESGYKNPSRRCLKG